MQADTAIVALGALAHEHRLAAYRLLVEQGPDGLPAGQIANALQLAPSSLSFHLRGLQRAGLVTQRRASRQLIYAADYRAMNDLLRYLTRNCCGRGAEACAPACEPAPGARRAARKTSRRNR